MGAWSEKNGYSTHDAGKSGDDPYSAATKNLSNLLEIASIPERPFLQVGVKLAGAISVR
jgi:hypothetical protein